MRRLRVIYFVSFFTTRRIYSCHPQLLSEGHASATLTQSRRRRKRFTDTDTGRPLRDLLQVEASGLDASVTGTDSDSDSSGSECRGGLETQAVFFFFFYQKPFITSMPHRQSWFHGTYDKLTNTLSYCYAISTYNSQTTVTNGIHILTLHQSQASSSLRFRRRPIPSDSNAMTGGGPYT